MNPRLPSSKKWTAFPADYTDQIKEVFTQGFETQLKDCKLIIEGHIYAQEILLRVGVLKKGRLVQANFEVSINYSAAKQDAVERIYNCIDAAASMMSEYFDGDDEGESELPRVWKEYEFDKQKLFMQFSTVNTELENQADALLAQADDIPRVLVQEEISEDALDQVEEILETETADDEDLMEDEFGEDDDDDDDSAEELEEEAAKRPTIFGGKKPKKREDFH
jgi:hypothetical protein